MNDGYDYKGVTITPQGGGHYDLSHPTLLENERVRGKENAEARAEEIVAAADAGAIAPQMGFDEAAAAIPTVTVGVTEGEAPHDPAPVVGRKFTGKLSDAHKQATGVRYKRIILEENPDIPPTGLYVGHNGRGYMIMPGVEVDVPEFLLGVLNDAKMSSPIVDPSSQRVLGYRERMRYPYRHV